MMDLAASRSDDRLVGLAGAEGWDTAMGLLAEYDIKTEPREIERRAKVSEECRGR